MAPPKTPFPVLDLASVFLDDHNSCIQTVGTLREQRRCSRPRNKNNGGEERIVRVISILKSYPPLDSTIRALLAELADLCYCNRSHRGSVDAAVAFWLQSYPKGHTTTTSNTCTNVRSSSQSTSSASQARTTAITPNRSNRSTPSNFSISVQTRTNENVAFSNQNHPSPVGNLPPEFTSSPIRRIFTRSYTQSTSQSDQETHFTPEHKYLPYLKTLITLSTANSALLKLINKPLGIEDAKEGYSYIFDRAFDLPNMNKVGTTTIHPRSRCRGWKSTCHYMPNILFSTELIPHARRVEQLTLGELAMNRKKESICKTNPGGCGRQHKEWVEAPLEVVREIMMHWVRFMEMEPYDEDGYLKDEWAEHATAAFVRPVARGEVDQGTRWRDWIEEFSPETCEEEAQDEEPVDDVEVSAAANTHATRRHAMPPMPPPTRQPTLSTVSQQQVNEALQVLLRAGVLPQGQTSGPSSFPNRGADAHSAALGRCNTFPLRGMQSTAVLA